MYVTTKGQLISEELFGVFDSSKKRTKTSQPEVRDICTYKMLQTIQMKLRL